MLTKRDLTLPIPARRLKTIVYAAAGLWIVLFGWLQLDGAVGATSSQLRALDAQLERCEGQFSKRYDCKSAILVQSGQDIFLDWSGRLAIILVPPLMLVGGLAFYNRKRNKAAAAEARKQAQARRAMAGMSRAEELQIEAAAYRSADVPPAADAAAAAGEQRADDPPPPPAEEERRVSADDVRRALFGH